jgi:hypothetical protein
LRAISSFRKDDAGSHRKNKRIAAQGKAHAAEKAQAAAGGEHFSEARNAAGDCQMHF